jgi:quercetin dioxygenase-like cupin family protein
MKPMTKTPYQAQHIEMICDTLDGRVAEITLSPMSDTPPHQHTKAEETCYCLEGELTCEVGGQATVLKPGERMRFAAGRDHCLRNRTDAPCRFLLVHGGGHFDFVVAEGR